MVFKKTVEVAENTAETLDDPTEINFSQQHVRKRRRLFLDEALNSLMLSWIKQMLN